MLYIFLGHIFFIVVILKLFTLLLVAQPKYVIFQLSRENSLLDVHSSQHVCAIMSREIYLFCRIRYKADFSASLPQFFSCGWIVDAQF